MIEDKVPLAPYIYGTCILYSYTAHMQFFKDYPALDNNHLLVLYWKSEIGLSELSHRFLSVAFSGCRGLGC